MKFAACSSPSPPTIGTLGMQAGRVGIEREGPAVALDRRFPSPQVAQRVGAIGVNGGVVRLNCDGPFESGKRGLKISRLPGEHAGEMQRVGMPRGCRDEGVVGVARLGELPAPMQFERAIELALELGFAIAHRHRYFPKSKFRPHPCRLRPAR